MTFSLEELQIFKNIADKYNVPWNDASIFVAVTGYLNDGTPNFEVKKEQFESLCQRYEQRCPQALLIVENGKNIFAKELQGYIEFLQNLDLEKELQGYIEYLQNIHL